MKALAILFFFFLLLFGHSTNFSIHLIHRDSPLSPFHNSSSSSKLLQNAALRSISRSKNVHLHVIGTDIVEADDPEGDYIMRIYIGSPPVDTWVIADTGSDLFWLQCLPCTHCFPQDFPFFNPKNSSTYKTTSCHSKSCTFLPESCGVSKQCEYYFEYADGSSTSGELGRDFVNFGGQSGNLIDHEVVFGCGHRNRGLFSRNEAGIIGLGNGPLSLVSQLGPTIGYKFAYCLVPYFSEFVTKLILGQEATISESNGVVSTPFKHLPGLLSTLYVLTMEGISIGKRTAKIDKSEDGDILIDSGTGFTFLPSNFYKSVEALVKEEIGVKAVKNPPENLILCYKNESIAYRKINKLNFVVHFKGAKLSLKPQNLFFSQDHNLLCFGIFPTQDTPIFGNVAQVNFEVEYDLKGKKVSFAPTDCTKNKKYM